MKTAGLIGLVAALLLAAAPAARADDTVWIAPASLTYHGVAGEYEHDLARGLADRRVSIAGGLALRSTAGGDYDSTTIGVAGEVRYWLRRHWYVAARLDLAHTTVTDEMDETIGRQHAVELAGLTGLQYTPWRRLEIRPYVGLAIRRESDHAGELAPWVRPGVAYGLALGWSF